MHKIPNFKQARVLVVGDVMLDRYWYGDTSRISPEAPVPVVRVNDISERPGGAGNVAVNLASLGVQAKLLGTLGQDHEATVLQKKCEQLGIQFYFQQAELHPTITKLRILSQHQQLIRLDFEKGYHDVNHTSLLSHYDQALASTDVVLLSDYAKGTLAAVEQFIQLAKQKNVPVFVDPKGTQFAQYQGAHLLTPNRKEFEAVVGVCHTDNDLVEKAHKLMQQFELRSLLITRGSQGMTLFPSFAARPLHLPAQAREVFDVTGAGDTVIAVLTAAVAAGEDLVQATTLANIAASAVVAKLGAATVTVQELTSAVREVESFEHSVVTAEQLQIAVAEARSHGERIVFTNGCFDILHAGHVTYLKQAKALGERLIVAVNSDDSIRRLKGADRPVNPLDKRMAVLNGLESIDWIVPFEEDTPEQLLQLLKPDILAKGGDYNSEDEVVGAPIVKAYGGEIKVLDLIADCSTTAVMEKIIEKEIK